MTGLTHNVPERIEALRSNPGRAGNLPLTCLIEPGALWVTQPGSLSSPQAPQALYQQLR
jgi:hypothetical protein